MPTSQEEISSRVMDATADSFVELDWELQLKVISHLSSSMRQSLLPKWIRYLANTKQNLDKRIEAILGLLLPLNINQAMADDIKR